MKILDAIYQEAYAAVVEEVELTDGWLSSNSEVSTDARSLLVHLLAKCGLPQVEIARLMGVSRSCVRKHMTLFDQRKSTHKMLVVWETQISLNLTSRLQRLSHEPYPTEKG